MTDWNQEISRLQEELLRLRNQVSRLQSDNIKLQSDNVRLESEKSEMQDVINNLRGMMAYFRKRLFGSMTGKHLLLDPAVRAAIGYFLFTE